MTASAPVSSDATSLGSIALIGGGPGDVDLLTLRAVERLRAADVILYDALAGAEILSFAPPHGAPGAGVADRDRAGHPHRDCGGGLSLHLAHQATGGAPGPDGHRPRCQW